MCYSEHLLIDVHCCWKLKKKKIYIYILLNFFLLFHLKNIFSFLLFLSLASLLSSFFLLIFFFLSLIYSLLCWSVLNPHLHRRFVLGSPSLPIFIVIAVPCRRPILPNPPSHCRSKHHCRPKLHCRSTLHQHCLHQTQEHCGFHGWLDFVGFSGFRYGGLAGFHGGWVLWVSGGVAMLVVICVVVFG